MITPIQKTIPVNASSAIVMCNQKLLARRFNVFNIARAMADILNAGWHNLDFEVKEVVPDNAVTHYVIAISHEYHHLGYYQSK